jgi:CubicO group peptidase (beta-lactamase class C family)
VIAKYQQRIPELMAEQDIPGLSVALVDGDRVAWTQGFGHVDGDGSAAVTTDTIFSVQSMSKAFTATAVMRAVQAGRLDLDTPIPPTCRTSPSTARSRSIRSGRSPSACC